MKEIVQTWVVPIGVFLTFLTSIIIAYLSRRNLITTKYIETITSERIKWLEIIRKEVSDLITNIHYTLKIYSNGINDLHELSIIEPPSTDYSLSFDVKTDIALGLKAALWSESDFILKLNLLKLRLNPIDDKEILDIIDYFIQFYRDSDLKSYKEISRAKEKIEQFLVLFQGLLKEEWKKCKDETKS
ncbi:MAG: hypothetical protein V1775_00315 [Bacteroidota bacterium]